MCVEPVQAMLDRAKVNNIANIQVSKVIIFTRHFDTCVINMLIVFTRLCVRLGWSSHRGRSALTSC